MITKEYAMAYREVIEILNHVPEEYIAKIPSEKLQFYQSNMDKEYQYRLDYSKDFQDQEISEVAQAILANIFQDYWATTEEKELENLRNQETYNSQEIFKNKQKIKENHVEKALEVRKENIWQKILTYIRKIFKGKE